MRRRTAIRYLLVIGLTWCVLAASTIVICVVVDPYRLFGIAPIDGWTAMKPRAYERSDLAKTYLLERTRPKTLLLGNSRIEVGLNPKSPFWPNDQRPVFNAGLAGRDLLGSLIFLLDDIAISPPKLVIVGLDFQDFIAAGEDDREPAVAASEARMRVDRYGMPNVRWPMQRWADFAAATLSMDALADSVLTLAAQNRSTGITMTTDGFNPLRDYDAIVRTEGARNIFEQKQTAYERQYQNYKPSDFRVPLRNPEFRYLAAIMHASTQHRIKTIFIIYPYHDQYFVLLRKLGLLQSFVAWKMRLAQFVRTEKSRTSADVSLFDFSVNNRFGSEQVPPTNDRRTQMQWYWEAGHFKNALGDKLIARMEGLSDDLGSQLIGAHKAGHIPSPQAASMPLH